MFHHDNCDHPRTKVARAACRRNHASASVVTGKSPNTEKRAKTGRGPRLPSVIVPKLRPIIDRAKELGLNIRVATDAPDGVEQMFIIRAKGKPNCSMIAEAFRAASQGREGKAEFYHIEDDRTRQLSKQRALADLETLAAS